MINEGWFTKYEKCANELKGVFFPLQDANNYWKNAEELMMIK